MPRARQAWFTITVMTAAASAAQAGSPPPPVCARNEVLDVVADDIARRGVDAVIVPGSVGETPTVVPNAVRCAVRLQTTFYDTNRYGTVPQVRLSIVEFTVHTGRNGLFVDAIGQPR